MYPISLFCSWLFDWQRKCVSALDDLQISVRLNDDSAVTVSLLSNVGDVVVTGLGCLERIEAARNKAADQVIDTVLAQANNVIAARDIEGACTDTIFVSALTNIEKVIIADYIGIDGVIVSALKQRRFSCGRGEAAYIVYAITIEIATKGHAEIGAAIVVTGDINVDYIAAAAGLRHAAKPVVVAYLGECDAAGRAEGYLAAIAYDVVVTGLSHVEAVAANPGPGDTIICTLKKIIDGRADLVVIPGLEDNCGLSADLVKIDAVVVSEGSVAYNQSCRRSCQFQIHRISPVLSSPKSPRLSSREKITLRSVFTGHGQGLWLTPFKFLPPPD